MRPAFLTPLLLAAALLSACGPRAGPGQAIGGAASIAAPVALRTSTASAPAMAALGRLVFFDASMSASGRMSCATCHDPRYAYAAPNALPVQLGGPQMRSQGLRAVPSLRYVLGRTPRWFKQYQADPIERVIETDSVPTGGFDRDGRFDTLRDQARAPLFDPAEMANTNDAALAARLRQAPYAADFRRVFGAAALIDDRVAVDKLALALERFELDDPSFHPYSSKFDRHLKGLADLSPQELRGLRLFVDPRKGNCASCHPVSAGADGSPPLLTDFTFAALGVPRNAGLAANADPRFFDKGLCGPLRRDGAVQDGYCGMFKTPSLRNVATRAALMHNGVFSDIDTAVRFYAERDIHPELWYPRRKNGEVERFDDLPPSMRGNVDAITAPMNRKPGDQPALSEADVQDIVAFLSTLTDEDAKQAPIASANSSRGL